MRIISSQRRSRWWCYDSMMYCCHRNDTTTTNTSSSINKIWILTGILNLFAFIALLVVASTCNFISVQEQQLKDETQSISDESTSQHQQQVIPYNISSINNIGILCQSNTTGNNTTISLISAIFLSISLFAAFISTIIVWYNIILLLQRNNKSFLIQIVSIITAIGAICCVPTFIQYQNDICTTTTTKSIYTCHFGIGSYLTLISCICLIICTVLIQCYFNNNNIQQQRKKPNIRNISINDDDNNNNYYYDNNDIEQQFSSNNTSLRILKTDTRLNISNATNTTNTNEGIEVPLDTTQFFYINQQQQQQSHDRTKFINNPSDELQQSTLNDDNNLFSLPFCNVAPDSTNNIVSAFIPGIDDDEEEEDVNDDDDENDNDSDHNDDGESGSNSSEDETDMNTNDRESSQEEGMSKMNSDSIYSTSMIDVNDEESILVFREMNDNPNLTNKQTATTNVDQAIQPSITLLPNVSLLDTDTEDPSSIHANDVGDHISYDLGSLEPSTIQMNSNSYLLYNNNNDEHTIDGDINGDESILDNTNNDIENDIPSPPSRLHTENNTKSLDNDIAPIIDLEQNAMQNLPTSNDTNKDNHNLPYNQKSVKSTPTKTRKKFDYFAFPTGFIQRCRKTSRLPYDIQQRNQQQRSGYRYLEDIEMDSLSYPIVRSPPLEILTLNKSTKEATNESSVEQQKQRGTNNELLEPIQKVEQALLYTEWNKIHKTMIPHNNPYSDEPEPYLEFSDEDLSDDDNGDDIIIQNPVNDQDVLNNREVQNTDLETMNGNDPKDTNRRSKNHSKSRRKRRNISNNHSSNRSVASSKTNLSLLSTSIAEETAEDLISDRYDDDNNTIELLNSATVPLVRSRSVPNLATFYSSTKTNGEIYDNIHMTGIHQYHTAHIFRQSTVQSSNSAQQRRNIQLNKNEYHSIDDDSSIKRRRQNQLWNNKYQSSSQSVPDKRHKFKHQRKTPLFRTERARRGIHFVLNDDPSTSSSSSYSQDDEIDNKMNSSVHSDPNILRSQQARLARLHRIQQQKQYTSKVQTSAQSARLTFPNPKMNESIQVHYGKNRVGHDENIIHPEQDSNLTVNNPSKSFNDESDLDCQIEKQQVSPNKLNETTLSTEIDDSNENDDDDNDDNFENNDSGIVQDIRSQSSGSSSASSDSFPNKYHTNEVIDDIEQWNNTATNDSSYMECSTGSDSYMIDLLDVQLAELNRPYGELIGPDEASL